MLWRWLSKFFTYAAITMQGIDSLLAASTPELHAAALALVSKSG